MDRVNLIGELVNDAKVKSVTLVAGQGLTGELQQCPPIGELGHHSSPSS